MICSLKHKDKACSLDKYHDGFHQDINGFKFFDEKWPNHLGNGPSGYPMNNPGFDEQGIKVLETRKEDLKKVKEFRRLLRKDLE